MSYETKIEAKNAAERAGRKWAEIRRSKSRSKRWLHRLAETFHEASGVMFNEDVNNPYVVCYLAIMGLKTRDEIDSDEVRDFWEGALADVPQSTRDEDEFFENFITGAVEYHDEV